MQGEIDYPQITRSLWETVDERGDFGIIFMPDPRLDFGQAYFGVRGQQYNFVRSAHF